MSHKKSWYCRSAFHSYSTNLHQVDDRKLLFSDGSCLLFNGNRLLLLCRMLPCLLLCPWWVLLFIRETLYPQLKRETYKPDLPHRLLSFPTLCLDLSIPQVTGRRSTFHCKNLTLDSLDCSLPWCFVLAMVSHSPPFLELSERVGTFEVLQRQREGETSERVD